MRSTLAVMLLFLLIPIVLILLQCYLCKKDSPFAIKLPIIAACFFIFFGFYAFGWAVILYAIYYISQKQKFKHTKTVDELDKMNIEDLE